MITYDSLKTKKKVQNILCIINLVTDEQKSGGKKLHKVAGTTVSVVSEEVLREVDTKKKDHLIRM